MIKLKQILSEIGEATLKPFEYKQVSNDNYTNLAYFYEIKINKNIKIKVLIDMIINGIYDESTPVYFAKNLSNKDTLIRNYSIQFDLTKDSEDFIINKYNKKEKSYLEGFLSLKEVLQLMTTIVAIIKEFIKTNIPKNQNYLYFFSFFPIKSEKLSTFSSRENLYMAYLKKNLPSDWIIEKKVEDEIYFYPKITN